MKTTRAQLLHRATVHADAIAGRLTPKLQPWGWASRPGGGGVAHAIIGAHVKKRPPRWLFACGAHARMRPDTIPFGLLHGRPMTPACQLCRKRVRT